MSNVYNFTIDADVKKAIADRIYTARERNTDRIHILPNGTKLYINNKHVPLCNRDIQGS